MAWDVVLCGVCRVRAVIWLKCVRNVIWDHLIYFIHWQPIWPECDPAISTGAPRSLPASDWSGVALLASDWLAGLTRSLTILEAQFTRALGREQHCAALYDPGHVRQSTQTRGGIPEVPAPNIPLMRLSLRVWRIVNIRIIRWHIHPHRSDQNTWNDEMRLYKIYTLKMLTWNYPFSPRFILLI